MVWLTKEAGIILLGDCIDIMKRMPSESIDLIITDPPYNISQRKIILRDKYHRKPLNYSFGEWDEFKTIDEFLDWTYTWLKEAIRLLKPYGTFYSFFSKSEISFFEYMLRDLGMHVRSTCCWYKTNPAPLLFKVGYQSGWEVFTFATKNKGRGHTFHWELGQQSNVFVHPVVQGKERTEHPTQKPLALIKKLITYSSNVRDIVLDPFLGSGTTAVACIELGRRYIGIEKERKWFYTSLKRILNSKVRNSQFRLNKYVGVGD